MKKIIFCIGIFCCFSLYINAQTNTPKSVIMLKNGSVFTGEIIVQTESTVVFKTADGTRYQFPVAEIENIRQQNIEIQDTVAVVHTYFTDKETDFKMMINLNGNKFFKSRGIGDAAALLAELLLGMNNIAGQNWFLGIGAGYENIFLSPADINLLKLFFRMQKIFLNEQKISPFASLDLGYSLISNDKWSGGILTKATGGISINIGKGNFLFFGINIGVQGCKTTLFQTYGDKIYRYEGTTFLPHAGISAAIMF
jgi:hypothetical protein